MQLAAVKARFPFLEELLGIDLDEKFTTPQVDYLDEESGRYYDRYRFEVFEATYAEVSGTGRGNGRLDLSPWPCNGVNNGTLGSSSSGDDVFFLDKEGKVIRQLMPHDKWNDDGGRDRGFRKGEPYKKILDAVKDSEVPVGYIVWYCVSTGSWQGQPSRFQEIIHVYENVERSDKDEG